MTTIDADPAILEAGAVHVALDGAVATVTLDRPEARNAQTPATWAALAAVGAGLPDDVRVVVLRGAGASFSAGLDRRMLSPEGVPGETSLLEVLGGSDQEIVDAIGAYQEGFTWLRDPRFVSVAAVQGHAIGAGFQLALSCDLRILADDALLSMREPALGLVPDLTGTKPLVEHVGYARALEICATARFVDAQEAERLGLANRVVAHAELEGAVAELTEGLVATVADAVRETKTLLQQAPHRSLAEQSLAERIVQVRRMRAMAALLG